MKSKKEYFILAAIIIGLILYLALHSTDRTHYELPDVPEVAGKRISKLEIGKSGESIVLNKKDNTWYIFPNEYPADSGKVKDMLDVIEKLTLTALVSESRNYIRYDLSEDKKVIVRAWTGDTLSREFEIGKAAGTYRHTHVMLAGDPNVYHARGDFRNKFDQTIDNLRDMTVLSFEQNEIREINITKDKKTTVVGQKEVHVAESEKQDTNGKTSQIAKTQISKPQISKIKMVWQTAEGKKLDESKLNRLLSSLSGLKCEKYISDRKKDDLKDPIFVVTLKGIKEYTLSMFAKTDKDAKNHPAISSENDYPFLLSDPQVDNIKTIIEEMLKTQEK